MRMRFGLIGLLLFLVAFGVAACGTLSPTQYREAVIVAASAPATASQMTPDQRAATQALADDAAAFERGKQYGQSLNAVSGVLPPPWNLILGGIGTAIGLGFAARERARANKTNAAAGLVVDSIEALKTVGFLDTNRVIKPADTTTGTPAKTVGDLLSVVQKEAGKTLVDQHQE